MFDRRFRIHGRVVLGICLMGAFLGGCITPIDPLVVESPDYQAGYVDGCTTAQDRQNGFGSRITRVEALFETDESYSLGWRNGYGACGGVSADPRRYNEDQWH